MKMEEIRELPLEELKLRLQDAIEELANLRIQLATRQLDNPMRVRLARKDVARLKTVIREYELGIRKEKNSAQSLSP